MARERQPAGRSPEKEPEPGPGTGPGRGAARRRSTWHAANGGDRVSSFRGYRPLSMEGDGDAELAFAEAAGKRRERGGLLHGAQGGGVARSVGRRDGDRDVG